MVNEKYKLHFTPAAIRQISRIEEWYNQHLRGLGTRFRKQLKEVLAVAKKNPFFASYRYDNVRFAVLNNFPYAAHYTIDEAKRTIIIHAVFGFSEDPEKWSPE